MESPGPYHSIGKNKALFLFVFLFFRQSSYPNNCIFSCWHVTPPFYRESAKPYQFYGESSFAVQTNHENRVPAYSFFWL